MSVNKETAGGIRSTMTSRCRKNDKISYTDVVVIGNGPSGITLSLMLSGNWPYYGSKQHPNEYLHRRLQDGATKSLVEQDLEYLSSGLEGRSPNPTALLLDALTHPEADVGTKTPSVLHWEHHPDKAIPHVVLGKQEAGGAWQMMEGSMQTLSLGNWMQLPDLPFKEWLQEHREKNLADGGSGAHLRQDRASIGDVREYYRDYVRVKGLQHNFRPFTTVTSVQRVLDVNHSIDSESGEQNPCSQKHCGKLKWEVCGYETVVDDSGEHDIIGFCYRARNVVLATGSFDQPNRLQVPGEHYPYVLHSIQDMERLIQEKKLSPESDPVVVIGAGLSAADAILCAQEANVPLIHMFRRDVEDPMLIFKKLPPALYPEYHQVHKMMKQAECDGYKSYPIHNVVEFMQDNQMLVRSVNSTCDTIVQVSNVLVHIGSRSNLSFLPHSGKSLGIVPGMHIDCKHNPIDVDPYSYQSVHEPGLFAMGPLVGDNFVRFLRGGALGITSHLWKKQSTNF